MSNINKIQKEKNEILSQKQQYETMVNELLDNQSKLIKENDNLKNQNIKLNEEYKQSQIELNDLKLKYNKLYRKHNIDIENYKNWNYDNITDWIISLDDGIYEKYENKLREILKDEEMCGDLLSNLDKNDLDKHYSISKI